MDTMFTCSSRLGTLSEFYCNGEFFFKYVSAEKEYVLSLYEVTEHTESQRIPYFGYTAEQVLKSGRDILGEILTANGEPSYSEVLSALPPITRNCYVMLGGPVSSSGLTVDPDGKVYNQSSGRDKNPAPVFEPTACDKELGALKPRQYLVDGRLPILVSVHSDGKNTLELLYFVEPTDPDRDPICWIRVKRYANAEPRKVAIEYRAAAISREADGLEHWENPPSEELFLDALTDPSVGGGNFHNAVVGRKLNIVQHIVRRQSPGQLSCKLIFRNHYPVGPQFFQYLPMGLIVSLADDIGNL